ncbi:hypothetical protein JO375_07150 [Paenibacillus sp. UY79]|nr:hypothetical protein [Paenibacillus farraposensis]
MSDERHKEPKEILDYSSLLRKLMPGKNRSMNGKTVRRKVDTANRWLETWFVQREPLEHPIIGAYVKTIRNWQTEVIYYHRCRWMKCSG